MLIGYARCSTNEQNLDWQLDALNRQGCERIYQEKFSGAKFDRPELHRMLDALREGDVVVVCELTRLSRSVKDLFSIVETLDRTKANIRSLKEPWLDTTTPQGRLLFSIFAGVSQFERELIQQRTMEGLKAARARGRVGGRPKVSPSLIKDAIILYNSKQYSIAEIVERTGVSKATLYAYLKKQQEK